MKKVWIGTLTAFAVFLFSLFLLIACNKREAPPKPTGVSAVVIDDHIRVSWNPVENTDEYIIRRYNNGGEGPVGSTTNIYYDDYDLYNNVSYKYVVIAKNSYGETWSDYSNTCVYSDGSSPLSAPTGLSAEVSGSRIYITWNSVSNASYYRIRKFSSSTGYMEEIGTTSDTYYYDSSPYTGQNYYSVTSVSNNGTESSYASVECQYSNGGGGGSGGGTAPSAPTGISATLTGSRVKITWNSVSNATEYVVDRSSTYYFGSFDRLGSTTNTYFYDDNPASGDNYYRVNAKNSYGQSYTTDHDYVYVSSGGGGGGGGGVSTVYSPCPVNYTSHTATSTTITLKWTNPTTTGCGTPTTAYLRVRNPDSGVYADLQTLSGTATTASFSYGMWANSEGYVYCGIITENSAGTSGGSPLVYNWKTNTWYGGKGLELTEAMENAWFGF